MYGTGKQRLRKLEKENAKLKAKVAQLKRALAMVEALESGNGDLTCRVKGCGKDHGVLESYCVNHKCFYPKCYNKNNGHGCYCVEHACTQCGTNVRARGEKVCGACY